MAFAGFPRVLSPDTCVMAGYHARPGDQTTDAAIACHVGALLRDQDRCPSSVDPGPCIQYADRLTEAHGCTGQAGFLPALHRFASPRLVPLGVPWC
jgi:hypothetical protein